MAESGFPRWGRKGTLACVLGALAQQALLCGVALAGAMPASFTNDFRALTRGPHRLAGRADGSLAAAEHVAKRLDEIGVREIYFQDVPVVQPRMTECFLEVDGVRYPIHAARPNVLQATVTPIEGLAGKTLYAGAGETSAYGRESPEGRIVLLDFENGGRWLDAFAFGARAVVFLGDPDASAQARHHVNVPANLPRFYVPAELAAELELRERPREVRLFAAATWEEGLGRNVIGVIRGTAPNFSAHRPDEREAVVLAVPLDSFSEIMERAPGARDAANVAALLRLAETLAREPPARDTIFAFFDGQTQNHLGARHFYGALYRRIGRRWLDNHRASNRQRLEWIDEEDANLLLIAGVLDQPDLLDADIFSLDGHAEALRFFRGEAARLGGMAMDRLGPARIELRERRNRVREIRRMLDPEEERGSWLDRRIRVEQVTDADEIAALQAELADHAVSKEALRARIETLEVEDLAWNSILRVVQERTSAYDPAAVEALAERLIAYPDNPELETDRRRRFIALMPEYYRIGLEETRRLLRQRQAELEQARRRAQQAIAIEDAVGQEANTIVLHISLNFGDARARWCFVHGDDSAPSLDDDVEGMYSGVYRAIRRTVEAMEEPPPGFDGRSVSELYPSRLFTPARYVDSGAAARMFGRFNVAVMTVMDPLPLQGLPYDLPERVNTAAMLAQADEFGRLFRALSANEGLSRELRMHHAVYYHEARWARNQRSGCTINQSDVGDPMRRTTVANALVAAVPAASPAAIWSEGAWNRTPPGFLWHLHARSQSDGIFEMPPVTRHRGWYALAATFAAALGTDEENRGLITGTTTQASIGRMLQTARMVDIFHAVPQTFAGYGFDRRVSTMAMRASSTAQFRADRSLVCELDNLLALFAPSDAKGAKLFNPYGIVLLGNEPTEDDYQGFGTPLANPFLFRATGEQTAQDLQTLNQYRLALLRENQIGEESLERLHGRAQDILEDARLSERDSFEARQGLFEASGAFSRRVYRPLVGVMQDLVRAVVFLLLLAIPFAFAMERLLIGTPHIYHRIGWFAVFFLATFILLYTVNPAFKLAATPVIIFLAFTIILLSSLVIFIMLKKLDTEMKKLQGRSVSAHTVDVSRFSTMSAAINMGISTMRRRRIRTLLTSITVILLTFTILTFASFTTIWGNRRGYVGAMTDTPDRILIRNPLWQPIPEGLGGTLRGFLSGRGEVALRYWLAPMPDEVAQADRDNRSTDHLLSDADAERVVPISAAIGLDIRDAQRQDNLRQIFGENARLDLLTANGIFTTEAVARSLGLTPQDAGTATLLFKGRTFVFGGQLGDEFARLTMLDGSSILPVDYKTSAGGGAMETGGMQMEAAAEGETASFVTYSADGTVVVPAHAARELDGRIRAIVVYPEPGENMEALADDVASVVALPTYAGSEAGVHRFFFSTLLEASGFRDLVIPVVLGGLIIFATMLGSVADREREIYAFSSLGLAPAHVAMLFFAEASIYAVVGGMGGYLVGQVAAKALAFLGRFGYFTVPAMNFSSMNAVATILIVMAIVLLSTIYPAVKAAKSANPGIQRAWKLTTPHGDLFDIRFPFTVSEYDLTGVVSYLREHFESYTDASIGAFATNACHILRQKENDMLGFSASVALAPFDLGIEQDVTLLSQPSDVEGIDEVRVLIRRRSGTYGDWQRANRVFVNDLRKQFLIWRTVDEQTAKQYREATLTGWDRFSVEARADILAEYGAQDA